MEEREKIERRNKPRRQNKSSPTKTDSLLKWEAEKMEREKRRRKRNGNKKVRSIIIYYISTNPNREKLFGDKSLLQRGRLADAPVIRHIGYSTGWVSDRPNIRPSNIFQRLQHLPFFPFLSSFLSFSFFVFHFSSFQLFLFFQKILDFCLLALIFEVFRYIFIFYLFF